MRGLCKIKKKKKRKKEGLMCEVGLEGGGVFVKDCDV